MTLPVPDIDDVNRAYFEGAREGELRVAHCPQCDALFRFAHAWCPQCWNQEIGWKMAAGTGTVESFTVIHQAPYPSFESRIPYVLALVHLDEGVRIMSNIVNCEVDAVRIGMAVAVTFEDRDGVFIPMFGPAG